jgi:hypothetical protein
MSHPRFVEGLESRQLLSAAHVFNATVTADRLIVHANLQKFKNDINVQGARLSSDQKHIRARLAKGDTSLSASFATLHTDAANMRRALLADRLTESANALADESTIKLDLLQILKDKGNASALATDHTKLVNDRVKLQNDLTAGLDARIATRQADEGTISTDSQAIVTAANSDPAATAGLNVAVAIFARDRVNTLNILSADLQAIETARNNLANALTASLSG